VRRTGAGECRPLVIPSQYLRDSKESSGVPDKLAVQTFDEPFFHLRWEHTLHG
jgi:hypothetical protein